jgi:hypothetical protein
MRCDAGNIHELIDPKLFALRTAPKIVMLSVAPKLRSHGRPAPTDRCCAAAGSLIDP